MNRSDIVQALLDLYPEPAYLEIGVDQGLTFNNVVAHHKRAVDPALKFSPTDLTLGNRSVQHFEMTSGEYFAAAGSRWMIDVAFIDGLHTFEQTLRDLLNVQAYLKPGGAIVIDDIYPSSYHASQPDVGEAFRIRDHQAKFYNDMSTDNSWMGNVYKLVFFVREFMQGWTYACVGETVGQMVLWRQPRPESDIATRSFGEVEATSFRDVVAHQDEFRFTPLGQIVAQVAAARSAG